MRDQDKEWIINRYMDRFKQFGVDIKTLASGNKERQLIRFKVFTEIGDLNGSSILDVGCGFADFYQYLKDQRIQVNYTGIDICPAFIEVSQERFPEAEFAVKDIQAEDFGRSFDYVISSQTFNNRLEAGENMRVMKDVFKKAYAISKIAVAIDVVSSYVDFKEDHLFYYSPEEIFRYCKSLTKRVILRHDYPLFEFMVCLYKDFSGWRKSEGSESFPTPHPERSPEATPRGGVEGSFAKGPSIRPSGSLRVTPHDKKSPRGQKIYISLTVDVDPDNFDESVFGKKGHLTFKGVEEGLKILLERTNNLMDDFGQRPRFTWFIRCDPELNAEFGTYTYLFEKYSKLWNERKVKKDEIAWHPHVTSLEELEKSFQALTGLREGLHSVRIGNAYQSNSLMSALAQMGFLVDSTALPGRYRKDEFRVLDWSITPQKPYYSSLHDYRVPSEEHLSILEVPMSMIETKVDYDKAPVKRYVNLSFRHELMEKSLSRFIEQEDLLVTNLHPSEVLSQPNSHPLLSFDIKQVLQNLRYIIIEAHRYRKAVQFVTMVQVSELVKQGKIESVNLQSPNSVGTSISPNA